MANHPDGTLYIGVTNDLARRVGEHRFAGGSRFTHRYYVKRLVWFEQHEDFRAAIQRETNLKRWPRAWNVALIVKSNPEWEDLYEQIR